MLAKKYMLLISILLLSISTSFAQYTIYEDAVFLNSSAADIKVYPHTQLGDGWVTFQLNSKRYSGDVNLLWGFNKTNAVPKAALFYNQNTQRWQTLPDDFANKRTFSLDGKNLWYVAPNVPVEANHTYKMRVYLDVQDGNGKYDFAAYPSSYGNNIGQAYNNGHLMLIDPWYNGTNVDTDGYYYPYNRSADDVWSGNDGTVNGATTTSGKVEDCYSFDGNDYISMAELSTVKSFQLWFKLDSDLSVNGGYKLIANPNSGTIYQSLFIGSPGTPVNEMIYFATGTVAEAVYYWNTTKLGLSTFSADTWYHLMLVWESGDSNYRCYLNGDDKGLADTYNSPSELSTWASPHIGRRGTAYFIGDLDEIAFFDTSLTSLEVEAIYNHQDNGYRLDEQSGTPPLYYRIVTLNNPASDSNLTSLTIDFNYTPSFEYSISNCSLYTNETGSWIIEETDNTITNNTLNTISHTFDTTGAFLWNVECVDIYGFNFSVSNYTLILSESASNGSALSNASVQVILDKLEEFNMIAFGIVAVLALALFLFVMHHINFPMFSEQVNKIMLQASYLLVGWLIAPIIYTGVHWNEVYSFGLEGTLLGIYTGYVYFMIFVSLLYFVLMMFNIFRQYRCVIR